MNPATSSTVLYITYDGLMEPIGRSQVFQYLRKLAADHKLVLVSYEKSDALADKNRLAALEAEVRGAGIRWFRLRYHKKPSVPATAYDIAAGFLLCLYLVPRYRIKVAHARSYVPSVIALGLKRIFGLRFIFDMRGFWADQRVDCGAWRQGSLAYGAAKRLERSFLKNADVVVSLTYAAVDVMRDFQYLRNRQPRFEVITTCTNLDQFHPTPRAQNAAAPQRPFILGCVGTVSISYLFSEMLDCFKIMREIRPDAKLHIINRGDHAYIREQLKAAGIPDDCVTLKTVEHAHVAREMGLMDAGIFFLKPYASLKAVAPTKLGEFLACGVPCLANAGVGDFDRILHGDRVGVVLRSFDAPGKHEAVRALLALASDPETPRRCAESARRRFSLEEGVRAYHRIYRDLEPTPRFAACREP